MVEAGNPKSREDIKILLIQFRQDEFIIQREIDSYIKYMKIEPAQLDVLNVFKDEVKREIIDAYDGVIVGGSGRSYVSDNAEWQEPVYELMRYASEINKPILGICFGAQLAAEAFGGKVENIEEMFEYGTYSLYLTSEGRRDKFFKNLPEEFAGQMGHKDSITRLPEGAVRLVFSDRVENQAFCFPGKKFYMVQYHPELDGEGLRERFIYYQGEYAENKEEYHEILSLIKESTDASLLLERFVDYLILDKDDDVVVKDEASVAEDQK